MTNDERAGGQPSSSVVGHSSVRGFDAIVGNPPYIRIQTMKEWAPLEVEYYKRAYAAAGKGNYDIYVVFVERALRLLNPRGRLGFILPHKFFNAQYGEPLRRLLAGGRHLAEIVHFGDQQVFHAATTYTCLLFLDRAGRDEFRFERVADLAAWREAREVDPKGLADLVGSCRPHPRRPRHRGRVELHRRRGRGAVREAAGDAGEVGGCGCTDFRKASVPVPMRFTLWTCFGERRSQSLALFQTAWTRC